ncbi:response regulator [Candidatus Kaiserbacteria bacterium]|nr:response regulator [Candidatus Kaiserbacteria bacterium]
MAKILVVEDDSQVRDYLRDMLEWLEHEVIEASNGKEALEILTDGVALVITDIHMPVMGGLEFIRRLKSSHPKLPAIAMSGELDRGDALFAGATLFLSKPLRIQGILAATTRALTP